MLEEMYFGGGHCECKFQDDPLYEENAPRGRVWKNYEI